MIYTVLFRRIITVRGMRIPPGLGVCPCLANSQSLEPWALGPASNKAKWLMVDFLEPVNRLREAHKSSCKAAWLSQASTQAAPCLQLSTSTL